MPDGGPIDRPNIDDGTEAVGGGCGEVQVTAKVLIAVARMTQQSLERDTSGNQQVERRISWRDLELQWEDGGSYAGNVTLSAQSPCHRSTERDRSRAAQPMEIPSERRGE